MKPIEFPEQNVVFAKDQPEYLPLTAFRNVGGMGEVISCWQLSWRERLRILWTGRMWSSLAMFGRPLTPSFFTTKKSDVFLASAGVVAAESGSASSQTEPANSAAP